MTVFWLDTALVLERLRAAVDRLTSDPNVLRVVLFGSFAEERAVPGSDVDVMIVLADDERPFLERISAFLTYFSDIGIGVDLFPYTVREMDNPLARRASETGILLFSR
ncbi:nucleotidyltransferase domain-containing protein [Methanoculleus frigidifontis]|uniref:nucleotidyltransferase domain-containing protein n=1 Tax=Methanoculleus frigidifontis TaxID=2584085 RepID=UPI00265B7172|nr:nucleotidyltransferase domain-containing protein [Methanoculleus sp. FWC-SCC1]